MTNCSSNQVPKKEKVSCCTRFPFVIPIGAQVNKKNGFGGEGERLIKFEPDLGKD